MAETKLLVTAAMEEENAEADDLAAHRPFVSSSFSAPRRATEATQDDPFLPEKESGACTGLRPDL